MSWLGKIAKKFKDAVFGVSEKKKADKAEARALAPFGAGRRMNQGPATQKYVKSLFPRSIFTKALSPWHEWHVRRIMRNLRPEQRAIARQFGYTKGLDV